MNKILGSVFLTFMTIIILWSCKKSFLDATSQDGSIMMLQHSSQKRILMLQL